MTFSYLRFKDKHKATWKILNWSGKVLFKLTWVSKVNLQG